MYMDCPPVLIPGKFTFHHQVQPWHPQSTAMHEAALAVAKAFCSEFVVPGFGLSISGSGSRGLKCICQKYGVWVFSRWWPLGTLGVCGDSNGSRGPC